MSNTGATRCIVVLVSDLIFEAKIRSTAQALGIETVSVRSAAALLTEVASRHPAVVIVDLSAAGPDPATAIRTIKASASPPPVIAFGSHVDVDLLAAARAAGAEQVLPRSRFSADLPQLLSRYASPDSGTGSATGHLGHETAHDDP